MKLRDYQTEAIKSVWDDMCKGDNALVVLPTGSGKSIVIYELLRKSVNLSPSIKAVVLFNRVPLLVEQTERAEKYLCHEVKNYCASINKKEVGKVTFASVQSLVNTDESFNLIICDECHVIDDDDSIYMDFIKKQLEINPKAKVVGFTATPYRADGFIYGKDRLFKKISYKKDLLWAIKQGFLVRPICKEPDHIFDTSKLRITAGDYNGKDIDALVDDSTLVREQVIDALNRMDGRKCIVWACANIKHAELVNEILASFGEDSVTVHSEQDDYSTIEEFKKGKRHLTFITVVAEGFDHAPIDCVVLMRPTTSPRLMVQICGRGLRTHSSKSDCLILDYAQVFRTLGTLDAPMVQRKAKGKKEGKAPTKTCPECRGINHTSFKECEHCGFVFPAPPISERHTIFADSDAKVLSDEETTMEVKRVVFSDYVSKSGNKCKVIEYHSGAFYEQPIKEYFVESQSYAMKRYELRKVQVENGRINGIIYSYEGKYPRVKRVICEPV